MSNPAGRLYVVATPIGNLGDVSIRARETLADVDCIAAEDTRQTQKLLSHLSVRTPMISLHEHNEERRVEMLMARLLAGESIALVSDAGTPLISDPGYRLVRAAREAGVDVVAIPGPSSVTAALSVAGLPTDRFFFEGFLPVRSKARRERLTVLSAMPHTVVVFEAGRRLHATLNDMRAVLGDAHEIAVCRELTKRFEAVTTGPLADVIPRLQADENAVRGELVIVLGPGREKSGSGLELTSTELLRMLRAEGLGAKASARIAATLTGESVNALYPIATELASG